jgi:hypothetical protein
MLRALSTLVGREKTNSQHAFCDGDWAVKILDGKGSKEERIWRLGDGQGPGAIAMSGQVGYQDEGVVGRHRSFGTVSEWRKMTWLCALAFGILAKAPDHFHFANSRVNEVLDLGRTFKSPQAQPQQSLQWLPHQPLGSVFQHIPGTSSNGISSVTTAQSRKVNLAL